MRYWFTKYIIGENMFSTGKNWVFNALGILCLLWNFWYTKGPDYLYQLPFDVLPKQTTCEMSTPSSHLTMISWWTGAQF